MVPPVRFCCRTLQYCQNVWVPSIDGALSAHLLASGVVPGAEGGTHAG